MCAYTIPCCWLLIIIAAILAPTTYAAPADNNPTWVNINAGMYRIKRADIDSCFDSSFGSGTATRQMLQYRCDGSSEQTFSISRVGKGLIG
jgi:hypothetical protein